MSFTHIETLMKNFVTTLEPMESVSDKRIDVFTLQNYFPRRVLVFLTHLDQSALDMLRPYVDILDMEREIDVLYKRYVSNGATRLILKHLFQSECVSWFVRERIVRSACRRILEFDFRPFLINISPLLFSSVQTYIATHFTGNDILHIQVPVTVPLGPTTLIPFLAYLESLQKSALPCKSLLFDTTLTNG
jgi:hypothetical protein